MQEHVKLEIALEVLINDIANIIRKINSCSDDQEKAILEESSTRRRNMNLKTDIILYYNKWKSVMHHKFNTVN